MTNDNLHPVFKGLLAPFMPEKSLSDMSLKELQDLKKQWYAEAQEQGKFKALYKIARELGQNIRHNYGPKYRFEAERLVIFVDDYGHYCTVHLHDKLIASDHNDRLYIPGEWESILEKHLSEAVTAEQKAASEKEEQERQKLINELSL